MSSIAGALVSLFGPENNIAKIKFQSSIDRKRGFRLLCESGYHVDCYKGGIFGLTSNQQIRLLNENNIHFDTTT